MAVEVKRGGRQDFTCANPDCKKGKTIAKGEPHLRTGNKNYKRYHIGCLVEEPKAEPGPEPVTEETDE